MFCKVDFFDLFLIVSFRAYSSSFLYYLYVLVFSYFIFCLIFIHLVCIKFSRWFTHRESFRLVLFSFISNYSRHFLPIVISNISVIFLSLPYN